MSVPSLNNAMPVNSRRTCNAFYFRVEFIYKMGAFYYCVSPCVLSIYRHIGIGIIRRAAAADRTKKIMVGCSTVIALLLCLSLLVLSLLGLPVTTEARTHVVFSSSPDIIGGDRYIPPPSGLMIFSSNEKSFYFSCIF